MPFNIEGLWWVMRLYINLLEEIFFPVANNSSIQLWELHRVVNRNDLEHYEFDTEKLRQCHCAQAAFIWVGSTDKSDNEISEQGSTLSISANLKPKKFSWLVESVYSFDLIAKISLGHLRSRFVFFPMK